jgi:hypothetical protein
MGKWRVARTGEAKPDYQYMVCRFTKDGVERYQYADTRAEAVEVARQANADSGATGVRA